MPSLPRTRAAACAALLLTACAAPAQNTAPLHQRIDQLIAGRPDFEKQAAPLASDAEFLRRIYLDLTGTIPPAAEARAFLADKAADKRARLIDRLLASDEFARHMQHVFDVAIMDRRPDVRVPRAAWQEFLFVSFKLNKPYDQLARDILSADGADPKTRPAAKFYLDRAFEPNQVTRDIGRLFLGRDLQCAQCHDHPNVSDYKQEHYYGIMAFLNRSYLFPNANAATAMLAEKADGEVTFVSVFDKAKVQKATGPRLPGQPPVKEPKLDKGKEYVVAPAKNARPVPSFSRRAQLAARITAPETAAFRRTAANRFWFVMMGRGIVHPLDLDTADNPPSHPELLDLLGDELAAHKYDVKWFLRELTLSRTYQRSSELPKGVEVAPETFAAAILKPLAPEALALAMMQATGWTDSERVALGKNLKEATLYAKQAGNLPPFVTAFGTRPGQPEGGNFVPTLEQTLFLKNGPLVRGWLAPRPGNLVDRLTKLSDPNAVADELFLSVLTRLPDAEERKEVAEILKAPAKDRAALLGEVAWALLASAEFRFNH